MVVSGCFGGCGCGCSFWFVPVLLLLFLNVAVVAGEAPRQLGANGVSLDACRNGVANDGCCKAINVVIDQHGCSCACQRLSNCGHPNGPHLTTVCSQNNFASCPRCCNCKCLSQGGSKAGQRPDISIDASSAFVANDDCCCANNNATCSGACNQLISDDHPYLPAACGQNYSSGCPNCQNCTCPKASTDGQRPYISMFLVVWICAASLICWGEYWNIIVS